MSERGAQGRPGGRVHVVGVSGEGLPAHAMPLLARARTVAASRRHRPLVMGSGLEVIPIAPLDPLLEALARTVGAGGDAVVLASGDPLFFGVGRRLIAALGPERLVFHPALSALQLACARLAEPWDGLAVLSMHGRALDPAAMLAHERCMVLCDPRNSPDALARALLERLDGHPGAAETGLHVAENLGLEDERLVHGGLEQIAAMDFGPLCMVLVRGLPARRGPLLGLTSQEFSHSRGLITKDAVRAVSLHCLALEPGCTLWDVGAGSGAVGIEAARLSGCRCYAVERDPQQAAHIRKNIRRHRAWGLCLVQGRAPESLAGLPAPDRVFVGGSGGSLAAILETARQRLRPGGRIVVNAVLERTETEALEVLGRLDMRVGSWRIQAEERHLGPDGVQGRTHNPITIITARA